MLACAPMRHHGNPITSACNCSLLIVSRGSDPAFAHTWQNGTDESFNGKFRDECLNMEWFRSRTEARVLIEIWRRHCNDVRPHSSLKYRTPTEFRRHHESTNQGVILK
jgi:hypothetical protein